MALPQTRDASAPTSAPRKDPEFRHVSGVRVEEIEILNKDPARHYVLVDDAADPRAIFCPEMFEDVGYKVERWPKFEGLKDDALERAKASALRFRGRPFGLPGEKMMARGNVLMSESRVQLQAMYAQSQKASDQLADAINPEKALARMRAEADPGRSKMALDLAGDGEMSGAQRFDNAERQ
jgi:hypothetical protein